MTVLSEMLVEASKLRSAENDYAAQMKAIGKRWSNRKKTWIKIRKKACK